MGRSHVVLLAATAVAFLQPGAAEAQTRTNMVVAGYGSVQYEAATTSDFPNDFTASVSPVFLFSAGEDFLFESELEFGLNGEATSTSLEYAQIDYLGFENAQIIAGKFLLPFGVFSERVHPSWINKLPTGPVLYGHAHGGVAEDGLLPVLADAGVMGRLAKPVGQDWALNISAYVTQGPRLAVPDDDHDEEESEPGEEDDHDEAQAPPVSFGTAFSDNNSNKMVGARIGMVKGPSFEAYASVLRAAYDDEGALGFVAGAVSVEYRRGGYELRGEGVVTKQEFVSDGTTDRLERGGVYAQISKRVDSWEPVLRLGLLGNDTVDGNAVGEGHAEFAIGLNFWFEPTIPLKLAYEIHETREDRLFVQWAFGF